MIQHTLWSWSLVSVQQAFLRARERCIQEAGVSLPAPLTGHPARAACALGSRWDPLGQAVGSGWGGAAYGQTCSNTLAGICFEKGYQITLKSQTLKDTGYLYLSKRACV